MFSLILLLNLTKYFFHPYYQVRSNEQLCEGNGQGRQWVCFPPGEVPMNKHGETQGWYIWGPSNERTHEGTNVWWSTEQRWTIHLAVIEVNSYKLPGKPLKCRIQVGNWKATEKLLPTQSMNVSQTALSAVTLRLFFKELWRFEWRAGWALSPRHSHSGRTHPRLVECKLSRWQLLVLETGYGGYQAQEEELEKTFHPWIASFVYFSVYFGTM